MIPVIMRYDHGFQPVRANAHSFHITQQAITLLTRIEQNTVIDQAGKSPSGYDVTFDGPVIVNDFDIFTVISVHNIVTP
jgi:hypothetical protein